ncbi:MAG: TolC family protein, partial [Bryobacteraceae bacterium]
MRYAIVAAIVAIGLTATAQSPSGVPATPPAAAAPLTISLSNALERAKAYNLQFQSATIAVASAHEDKVQAKAALFPTLNALNQYIYTQGNLTPSGVFVANDGVHVYNEQATVHADLFSATRNADYRKTIAAEAVAQAKRDVAARGLVTTVVQDYYAQIAAERHLANAKRSVAEAQTFFDITQKQQRGGEVARSDVIKAQLQLSQRQRDLMDAATALQKAKLAVAVLLFPDIDQPFELVDDLQSAEPLPAPGDVRAGSSTNNPDIRAAEAGVVQAKHGINSARGAYYPSLAIDYFYGIDANVFGIRGPGDRQNLGSAVQGTVTVPVWNWGATRSKVRQAQLLERQAE